ncbi:Trypanosoma vivax [Trypanosoma rangeli]|uniref:Trypanosoma vivax n=1 Tax=Trypanosoma rangeli TaxID=5698 RepID=A0A422N9Y0_TRYRA|nr:Trypanosoma vivax [Trypanosoma rangeli]RNF02226.1 Trypanosoma vivax [Trypanosoma rangeli]|eukprot:RNF02226.1 Trypanosoma vivax [Trypanosoma rangeli]
MRTSHVITNLGSNVMLNMDSFAVGHVYKRIWSQVVLGSTSGLMIIMVLAVLYSVYALCLPYGDSISLGILLSVMLHSKSTEEYSASRSARRRCVERMQQLRQKWVSRSTLFGVVGSLLSLGHFFMYASMQGVMLLGLNKLFLGVRRRRNGANRVGKAMYGVGEKGVFLTSTSMEQAIMRLLTVSILVTIAHFMIGFFFFFQLHAVLLVVFAITVMVMSEERFTAVMWCLWRTALILFFTVALSYNMAADVLSVSDAVKRATSAVVHARDQWSNGSTSALAAGSTLFPDTARYTAAATTSVFSSSTSIASIEEMIMAKLQQTVLKELADTLKQSNVTELAVAVRRVVSPLLTRSPSEMSIGSLRNISSEVYTSLFRSGGPLRKVDWVSVLQNSLQRWRPVLVSLTQLLFELGSNVMGFFDSVYASILFVCVLRYFLQLEHTILYYVVAKMLRVIHSRDGERHARIIEREITVSFRTLLQSFWHLSWFHFCITFCLFSAWSFPTPFFCGVISTLTAVFPLTPKWVSPVALALGCVLFSAVSTHGFPGAVVDQRVWSCLLAFLASYLDEWLLCVSRGLRGDSLKDAAGVEREQMPTFVIGTAVVLGYVRYGVRGILFGPMTVILAKVLFDNWDMVTECEAPPPDARCSAEKNPSVLHEWRDVRVSCSQQEHGRGRGGV